MMNPNETRSLHPSSAQFETLVKFMERNPDMAKGFLRTQKARERSRRQWEELTVRLNSLGGTIKTYKQWTKYWSDKKGALKKKVAMRSAARRNNGGSVENEVELSELEERVVALCGGESFATGDAHLGIQPFPENDTSSPSQEAQQIQDADTDNIPVPQKRQSQAATEEPPAIVIYGSELIEDSQDHTRDYRLPHPAISRTLFASSSSSSVGTSQSILRNNQLGHTPPPNPHIYRPTLSPPPITLSHTPTPSLSSRSSTQVASPVVRRCTAASSSSHHASPIASPSRRPRTNMIRVSRGIGSVSSRHTSSVAAPPPSQRRMEFSTTTDRFLRVEEQQLEIQRLNAQILQSFLERSAEREKAVDERGAERDRILAEAVAAVGQGLQALAAAKNIDPNVKPDKALSSPEKRKSEEVI